MASNGISRPGDATVAGLADRTTGLVGWTIVWRATSAVATLALGAFLIRQLSPSDYGRYTFVLSVLVYIALLATFGQDQGLLRYLPEVIGRGDRAAAHDLLRKSAIAIFAVWALTSAAVLALRPLIDSLLQAHVADLLALGTVLLLGGIATGALSFALVAIYDMRSQAIATPIAGALTLALAVILLRGGGGLNGILVAGAIGQAALAVAYFVILMRRINRAGGIPGDRIGWRRLLVYASGWLPSLLTGAWVVGTLEGWRRESDRIRTSVAAFYKGIFLVGFPLAFAGGALLGPVIRLYTNGRYPPSERIAPLMLLFFIAALLATPWGLVVRVRELAWLNALITIAQLGFAAVADFWLIQRYGLGGAVVAVGLTTALTLVLTFVAWRAFDRTTINIPWRYAGRCMLAASPYLLLLPLAFTRLPARLLVLVAVAASALTTVAWGALVRRLGLLAKGEVSLLHESRHAPVRFALRYLAPSDK